MKYVQNLTNLLIESHPCTYNLYLEYQGFLFCTYYLEQRMILAMQYVRNTETESNAAHEFPQRRNVYMLSRKVIDSEYDS